MKRPVGYWLARLSLWIFPTAVAMKYVESWDASIHPPPKPRRTNKIPPDEERCEGITEKKVRCKFRRAEGERCSIHRKIWEREMG